MTIGSSSNGTSQETVALTGDIRTMTAEGLLLFRNDLDSVYVPAESVKAIQLDLEPIEMTLARTILLGTDGKDALAHLERVQREKLSHSTILLQEYDYLRTMARIGAGRDAVEEWRMFVEAYPKSVYYYRVNEWLGMLLVHREKYDEAKSCFERLCRAESLSTRRKGNLQLGECLLHLEQIEKARVCFRLIVEDKSPETDELLNQKYYARLGLARTLALENNIDEALKSFHDLIENVKTDDTEFWAKLYNGLGETLLRRDRKKEALLAFLHVDLLYPEVEREHVRALSQLYELWTQEQRTDRAREVLERLESEYDIKIHN